MALLAAAQGRRVQVGIACEIIFSFEVKRGSTL
jgi:hypothetical protein